MRRFELLTDKLQCSEAKTVCYEGDAGYKAAVLGRAARKEAMEIYSSAEPTKLTDKVKDDAESVAKSMGIVLGPPMTFNEANHGLANTGYGTNDMYAENCQCTAVVHEARLRGLPITALPYSADETSTQYKLGQNFNEAWVNVKGEMPQVTRLSGKSDDEIFRKIDQQTTSIGRYHIGLNYKNDSGHLVTAERIDGKLYVYDAQDGEFISLRGEQDLSYVEILKVDKLLFAPGILTKISKPI